jgi:hypothetical protein
MIRAELFDGTVLEFEPDTPPDVVQRVAREHTLRRQSGEGLQVDVPARPDTPAVPAAPSAGQYASETAAIGLREGRRGVAQLLGAPVDLVSTIMGAVGLPTSQRPFLGSEMIDQALGTPNRIAAPLVGMDQNRAVEGPTPRDAFQRVVGRVGKEIGANVLPVAGAIAGGARVGAQGARAMQTQGVGRGILGQALEAGAVNPAGLGFREAAYAGAAGTGAGIANEIAGNPQNGDNFLSDFFGSLAGVGAAAGLGGLARTGAGAVNAATGQPVFRTDVANEAVASDIMANSTRLQEQYARRGSVGAVDTADIVQALRRPSAAEEVVPGFRANIADRTQDPGLATFTLNREAAAPGYASARRVSNETAISEQMARMAPEGDPAQFRAALETNRAGRIAAAEAEAEQARLAFEAASREVAPGMDDATARGSSVRAALADAYAAAQQKVREAYTPIDEATVPVDAAPLAERFAATREALPLNDRQRFLPSEAAVPEQLVTPAQPAQASPILDAYGQAIMRPEVPASGQVPLNEITSIRSGLTDDVRAANATPGQAQRARVAQQFRAQTDEFLDSAVPPELRQQLDAAREVRRDVADRFERPGTGMQQILQPREGGGYQLDDSAVARTVTPTDQGRLTDFRDAIREAGTDTRLRSGIADEVLSQAQRAGVVNNPQALQKFLDDRSIVLAAFPELRDRLTAAGAARGRADTAARTAETTRRDLTTPARSPEANYLRFGDEATVDAVRTVTTSPQPAAAMRQLIDAAGGTPEARLNARSALWEVVKRQRMTSPGVTGGERWNGSALRAMFDDPKTAAAAREAWADNPDDLANVRRVFDALATSEGSTRARVPGSSGTAQQLFSRGFDARSVSSSLRSVNQGRSSIASEFLYQAQGMLRQRSARMQARAIEDLTNQVINTPGMAADLLERFNPADFAARGRMISQKYGLRNSMFFNLLDEDQEPDAETRRAIMGDTGGNR